MNARHAARFQPTLEALDDRLVPSADYWIGAVSTDASDPANWSGWLPAAYDVLYFTGPPPGLPGFPPPPPVADCYGLSAPAGGGSYGGIWIASSYTATITFGGAITTDTFDQAGGEVSQPTSGTDLTVTNLFHWTAGTLNSSSHLSTVTITGAATSALVAPTNGGTVNLGSSIELSGGAEATLKEGTINVTNTGTELNINAGCGMLVDPGADASAVFSSANVTFRGQININGEQSWLKVYSGRLDSLMPLKNSGGSLILLPNTLSTFQGEVDGVGDGPSVRQTAGAMYLYQGSILEVSDAAFGLIMSGGVLSIQLDQGFGPAEIIGDVKISGGDIVSGANDTGDNHLFGTLKVEGNVSWTGGTYRPFVGVASPENYDHWFATGLPAEQSVRTALSLP